jgi:pre-mRNA-splicing factor ISY1
MARPAEKARAMMNKWVALREKGNAPAKRSQRRPHLASECEFLSDAERFRGQIVREISSLIEKIQNPALGDHEVREANDDVSSSIVLRALGVSFAFSPTSHCLILSISF